MRIVAFRDRGGGHPQFGELCGDNGRPLTSDIAELADLPDVQSDARPVRSRHDLDFLPASPSPSKVICIGMNYRDHAEEAGLPVPDEPLIFSKHPSAPVADGAQIRVPSSVSQRDWEVELAVVVGRRCASVPADRARDVVLGFTCFNDVSARDIQSPESRWTRARSFDTFAPLGPCIVPPDEIPDPDDLSIKCRVNGEVVQSSRLRTTVSRAGTS